MPQPFTQAVKDALAAETVALTTCIRLQRLDNLVVGFTSLDQDLTIEGVLYEAFTSVDASELASSVGTGVSNLDIIGLISSDRITEREILAGIWDGAGVQLFFWLFEHPELGKVGPLIEGTLGDISEDGGQFNAEIRGNSQRLSQQIVELTGPLCRAPELFGTRCMPLGYNEGTFTGTILPAAFRHSRVVEAWASTLPAEIRFDADAANPNTYRYGKVTFTSGQNIGLSREVKSHIRNTGDAIITLQDSFPYPIAIGDVATLEEGCDRRWFTCKNSYDNFWNFAAEPMLPGNTTLTQRGRR